MNRWLTAWGSAAWGSAAVLALVSMNGAAAETAGGVAAFPAATVQETTSSTLDGVFTSAQARRGRRVYNQNCASCHGQQLRGGEMAPGVAGRDFIVFWTEIPVGSLFERVRMTMPEDGPGRLSDQEYSDVVAYMLDRNDYPSGETELPVDKAALDRIMIVAAETAAGGVAAFPAAAGQETTSSTLDGVFTSAQARRGRRVYNQNCASCHGQQLRGGEMAPGVAGRDFIVFWTEIPVGSLFERVRMTMPEDGPGRLSDQEYSDVVAYMLDRNDYPSGETELPVDKAALDRIMIVAAE